MGSAKLILPMRHLTMTEATISTSIPARPAPGSTRAAPSAVYQGGGEKLVTGSKPNLGPTSDKIRIRDTICIGTWNVRSLRASGKLEELAYEMDRYRYNIIGLCETRWKNIGEASTNEGHKLYFSGNKEKHERGVGFLVHKDTMKAVMGCRPVSDRIICIRLKDHLSTSP